MIKYKKIIIMVIVLVLFMSLLIFPWFSFALGFSGVGLGNFVITCIFISVWLFVLLVAVRFKSKALFNIYNYYWLAVTITCLVVFAVSYLEILEGFAFALFSFFLTPIIGIYYLNMGSPMIQNATVFFFSMLYCKIGFFAKRKALK